MQKELDNKNATIESQNRQLEQAHTSIQHLTEALASAQLSAQQAQVLHAGTMQNQLEAGVCEQQRKGETKTEKNPGLLARIFGNK